MPNFIKMGSAGSEQFYLVSFLAAFFSVRDTDKHFEGVFPQCGMTAEEKPSSTVLIKLSLLSPQAFLNI